MSAAFASSWPGSRVLLGWWRELLARQPQQLWFGRLLLHRVEALVGVTQTRPLDLWQRALLHLVGARVPQEAALENAFADLRIDRQVLSHLVRELTGAGLLQRNGAGAWRLTAAGRSALETGALTMTGEERRTFFFVDNASLRRPPHFLSLRRPPRPAVADRGAYAPPLAAAATRGADATPLAEVADWSFDRAALEACIGQPTEWKARHHFPADVKSLQSLFSDKPPADNWRRVILDSLEQLALVFIRTAASGGAAKLLGFRCGAEGEELEPEPMLVIAESWQDVLPDLAEEPSPEAWRQAWQTWSEPRGLPPVEVAACRLERVDHRLVVHAPPRLIERLRTARSDAIKQEAWILAGSGRVRAAAQLELLPL